jgi:MFS family permease
MKQIVARRPQAKLAVAFGGMLALASAMGIGRFVYTPILPSMMAALGLGKSAAGLIAAGNFAGYLAGALLLAVPRPLPGGRRAWLLGGLLGSAALTTGMAAANDLPAFLLLRFAGGLASAVVLVLGSALVLDGLAGPPRGGRYAALHFAGVGAGIAMSAVVIAACVAAGLGWRVQWLASGAVAAVLALPVCLLVRGDGARVPPPRAAATAPAAAPSGLAVLTLCHGLFGFGYVVTATFLVAVVRSTPQARPIEPLVWLAVGLAAMPSVAGWSRVATRLGARRAYALACALEAVGVAIGGAWTTPSGALISAALLGATFMGITALGFTAARGLVPPERERQAFAVMTAGFGAGQMVGPVVAGLLLDATGGFLVPSLLAAGGLAAAAVLVRRG